MARILFFWILLFCSFWSKAQYQHFSEHAGTDLIKGMACINHKSYYLERMDFGTFGVLNMVAVDGSGQVAFKKQLLNGDAFPFSGRLEIRKTLDNHLICVYGASQSCDVIGGPIYFSKLDTSGNFKFTVTLPVMTAGLLQYTDSSYYLNLGNTIRHYSKSGALISDLLFPGSIFRSVSQLNNGNLFCSTSTAFCEIDTAGNYIQIIPANHSLKKMVQLTSGNIVALSSTNTFLFMNPAFSILHQSQFNGMMFSDFEWRNDSLFAVGHYTNSSTPFYGITDTLFNVLYQSNNSLSDLVPSAIALSANNLINVSVLANGSSSARSRAFFRFPITGDFILEQDVGIDTVKIIALNYQFANLFNGEFEVQVRNHSNKPAKGFNLNANRFFGICPYTWQRRFDTLIPAGGMVKVNTGTLSLTGYISGQNSNLCLYTTTPDAQVDLNRSNDSFCLHVALTSWDENRIENQNCTVYPNPFNSSFTIQSEPEIKGITVVNALGKVVCKRVCHEKEVVLDLQELEPGVYFVRIESERGSVSKKLFKQ